jgi:hypothetical protein
VMVGRRSGATTTIAATLSGLVLACCGSGSAASSEITPLNVGTDTSTSPSPAPTSNPLPIAPPATVTVVTTHELLPNGQASLDPPGHGQAPTDPTAAWNRIASNLPGNPCGGARATTVQFGLLTFSSDYNKVPEWVLRCIDSPAPSVVLGPAAINASPLPTPSAQSAPLLEDFISVFAARTGKLLLGWNESPS